MVDARYEKPQFKYQDIFRTITVAFQPYVPFTQAYRMAIVGGHAMQVAGRGKSGYFHWAPIDAPEEEQDELMGSYPWKTRLDAYSGQGSGRLSSMSVNPIRTTEVLSKVDSQQGEGSATVMGEQLKELLDNADVFEVGAAPAHTPRSSRIMQEIELNMVSHVLGEMAEKSGTQFGDYSNLLPPGTRDPLYNRGNALGRSFDVLLEHTHSSFNKFLEETVGLKGSSLGAANIHSLEISMAKSKIDKPSKLLTGIDASGLDDIQIRDLWRDKIQDVVSRLNTELDVHYTKIIRDMEKELTKVQVTTAAASIGPNEAWRALETEAPIAKKGDKDHTWEEKKMMSTVREFIQRMKLDMMLAGVKGVEGTKHLWSAPLGDHHVGITIFSPKFVRRSGVAGIKEVESLTDWPIPQIHWNPFDVFVLPALDGDIINAYVDWMKNNDYLEGVKLQSVLDATKAAAASEAVATEARIAALGSSMQSMVTTDVGGNLGISVSVPGLTQLRPTKLAQELFEQIEDYYSSGRMKKEVQVWYEELMHESNKLTRAWFDAQEMGRGPVVGTPNTMGTTRSSEYVLGDELGNPRKHYLGVWSDRLQDTWSAAGEGSKGDVGYNFAIAPFITSRRAGTALFGKQKKR